MKIIPPTNDGIEQAAAALRAGKVIAYPTETIYGLGVDPFSEDGLKSLYAAKGRDANIPVLLIVSGLQQLDSIVSDFSPRAKAYADAFWPGPLSMLFPPAAALPESLLGDQDKVCIRWTDNAIASSICDAFGDAIVSTSANRSGDAPALSPNEVPAEGVELCIDGGTLQASAPSTILDPETGEVIREGAIPRTELEEIDTAN